LKLTWIFLKSSFKNADTKSDFEKETPYVPPFEKGGLGGI
jgi:hypothetical protein